jgi:hypothetical protein
MKTESHRSRFDRVDAAQEERNERERLRDEARYRRERLDLYRARLYGGRAASRGKLSELQRASDAAAARLRRAEAKPCPVIHPPERCHTRAAMPGSDALSRSARATASAGVRTPSLASRRSSLDRHRDVPTRAALSRLHLAGTVDEVGGDAPAREPPMLDSVEVVVVEVGRELA